MKLSTRIFALAFINLALLAGVFLAFAHYQFHLNFSSLLVAPSEDRVRDVARSVASDLGQTQAAARTSLMARYAAIYGVDFYLFDNDGPKQLAGKPVELPAGVKREIAMAPPGEQNRPPPPRAEPPPPRAERPPPPPPRAGPPPRDFDGGPAGPEDFGPPPPRREPPPPRRPRIAAQASSGLANPRPKPSAANASYQTVQRSEAGLYWALTRIPVIDPATGDLIRGTLLMVAPSFLGTPLFFDFRPWLAAFAAAIAVFVLCWLPFIRGLSRSISRLTVNTGRIAQGDFENHLPENRRDEIGQLSVSINRMAERLSGFVTGQKRFLGDIAHELSAPIARIQFALGILEQRASDDQQEAVEDLREEIAQMSGLVGELLSFSKAGLDAASTALVATEIAPLAQQAVAREASVGAQITVEIPQPVTAIAEPNLLLRALSNLIRNAVRYAGADGPITISASQDGNAVLIAVSDSGPGLPPDELDRVFTPFYRLDASRNRSTGGAGLGLAIVKSCVEASGGTVQCRNREPHGLEVEIRLKAAT
jgi:two-component system sensor histidine kinase CpxA